MPPSLEKAVSIEDGILMVVASVGLLASLVAALFMFFMQYASKLRVCCLNLMKRPQKAEYVPVSDFLRNRPKKTSKAGSNIMVSVEKHKFASFRIPGRISVQMMQPVVSDANSECSAASGGSAVESAGSTVDSCSSPAVSSSNAAFLEEYVQPPIKLSGRLAFATEIGRFTSAEELGNIEDLQPELYKGWRRTTAHNNELGKVQFSLQYEDKTRRNLIINLKNIDNMQYSKPDIAEVYVSMILLPEREYKYVSKHVYRNSTLFYDQQFVVNSRPHNRDFESRTIVMTILCVEKSSREIEYGECRMPLLSREIYSQVPTEVSLGIRHVVAQGEVGDAQIVLSYSSQSQKLSAMINSVRFPSTNILENMNSVHVKAFIALVSGERLGKKRSISQPISSGSTIVTFSEQMTFKLRVDELLLSTLKLNIHGRHKIMRKHTQIGKIRVGESSKDQCAKVHWKTALTSADIGWTMWHPIYGSKRLFESL